MAGCLVAKRGSGVLPRKLLNGMNYFRWTRMFCYHHSIFLAFLFLLSFMYQTFSFMEFLIHGNILFLQCPNSYKVKATHVAQSSNAVIVFSHSLMSPCTHNVLNFKREFHFLLIGVYIKFEMSDM